jgi:transcription elongation factor GreA
MIEGEIVEIETKLKYAVIIKDDAAKKGIVSLGSKVDLVDEETGEKMTCEIVGTTEADVEMGRISNESPVGNALLGRKEGDNVKVQAPAGITSLTIKKVY